MIRRARGRALADARRRTRTSGSSSCPGTGESFCAGADLNWMREIIRLFLRAEPRGIARRSPSCLYELYALPKPTIARVNGAAIGGGAGFLSACDIVVASTEAQFGLSEVKIGLVPAAHLALRRAPDRGEPGPPAIS